MGLRKKIIKKLISLQFSGWSHGSLEEQRFRQEKLARYARLAKSIRCQPLKVGSIDAEWIEALDAKRIEALDPKRIEALDPKRIEALDPKRIEALDAKRIEALDARRIKALDAGSVVVLYLHGGAYALGSINVHREWISRLAIATKTRCLAINYRLAPEHPFPAALDDTLDAYGWLISQGFDASQIIIAGDSAGGGLALAALVSLRDAGDALPAGAICLSPWVDLTLSGDSIRKRSTLDPILHPAVLKTYARYYAGNMPLTHPLISPLYADLRGLPPLLFQVGTDEILLDDAKRIAEVAKGFEVDVTLGIWKGMFHVFHLIPFLPETKQALTQIADFVSENTAEKANR
jgi:acetyl esterase/lipase